MLACACPACKQRRCACLPPRPPQVGFVSKSGGMSNEMYNVVARAADGIYEGESAAGAALGVCVRRACHCHSAALAGGRAGGGCGHVTAIKAWPCPACPAVAEAPHGLAATCCSGSAPLPCRHRHWRGRLPRLDAVRPLPAIPKHPPGAHHTRGLAPVWLCSAAAAGRWPLQQQGVRLGCAGREEQAPAQVHHASSCARVLACCPGPEPLLPGPAAASSPPLACGFVAGEDDCGAWRDWR